MNCSSRRTRLASLVFGSMTVGSLVVASLRAAEGPIVRTEAGRVQGTSGEVVVFKGIPFARPPVGNLRWTAPSPPERWSDVEVPGFIGNRLQARCVEKRIGRASTTVAQLA
jgi:para-nitrobenzyl esterase